MINRKIASVATGLAIVASMAVAIPAFAQTTPTSNQGYSSWSNGKGMMNNQGRGTLGRLGMIRPVAVGKVTTVSGNTITINSQTGPKPKSTEAAVAPLVLTIDATNAVVIKNNATSTVGAIVVGDTIAVQGTVTGTNVVATTIRDGLMTGKGIGNGEVSGRSGTSTPRVSPIQGNGQPVVAGSISVITGTSLTVTTQSGVTYTVDAANAKIVQGQTTINISNLAVGNPVVIQGTVNGTVIVASSILDQVRPAGTTNNANGDNQGQNPPKQGFFRGIGNFFAHMFGF
jgi:hypothetical protein